MKDNNSNLGSFELADGTNPVQPTQSVQPVNTNLFDSSELGGFDVTDLEGNTYGAEQIYGDSLNQFSAKGTGDVSMYDYDFRFTYDSKQRQFERYSNQPILHSLYIANARFANSLATQVIKGITDIPDVIYNSYQLSKGTPENMAVNPISKALQDYMDYAAEQAPIYTNPYKGAWDPGSANWWLSHVDSLATAASYIVPSRAISGGIVKGLGAITKAAKAGAGLRSAQVTGSLLASLYTTTHEALGTIIETHPKLLEAAKASGMSEEEAKEWAAGQASQMYKTNLLNVLPEAIGIGRLLKKPIRSRNLIEGFGKRLAGDVTSEMIPEAFQEAVNLYSQKNALREADILLGKEEFGYSIMNDFLNDEEAWTAMTMGAVGGKAFQSLGRSYNSFSNTEGTVFQKLGQGVRTIFTGMTSHDAELRQKQKEVAASYNETMLAVSSAKDAAELTGDTELAAKLDNILTVNEAYRNFELGSTETFENTLNTIREHAIETGDTELQQRVESTLKRTLDAERIFNDTYEVFPRMESSTRKQYVTNQTEINRLTEQSKEFERRYNDIIDRDEYGAYEIPDRDRKTLEEYFDIERQLREAYDIIENGDPNLDGESNKRTEAIKKAEELEKLKKEKEKVLNSSPSATMAMEMSRNNFEIERLQEAQKELIRGLEEENTLTPFEEEVKREYERRRSESRLGNLVDKASNENFIRQRQEEDFDPLAYSDSIDFNLNEENLEILDSDLVQLDQNTDEEINQNEINSIEGKRKFLEDFVERYDDDLDVDELLDEELDESIEDAENFINDIQNNENYESDLTEEQKAEKAILEQKMRESQNALVEFEKVKQNLQSKKQKISEARDNIYEVKERKMPSSTSEIVQEKVEQFFEIVEDNEILNVAQLNDYLNTLTRFKEYIKKHFNKSDKEKIKPFIDKIESNIKKAADELKNIEKAERRAQEQSRKDFIESFDVKEEKDIRPTPVDESVIRNLISNIKDKFRSIKDNNGKRLFSDKVLDEQSDPNDNLFTDVASYIFSVLSLAPNVDNKVLKAFKISMDVKDLIALSPYVQNPGELKDLIELLRQLRKHQLRNRVANSTGGTETMRKIYEAEKALNLPNKPFYQQLNAIRELVAMFFNSDTKYSYLQGVAGSGKSKLVTKYVVELIIKIAGTNIKVGAYAPGANANAVISESINGTAIKEDYFESNESIDKLIQEAIDNKLDLIIIDEAGKLNDAQVEYLYQQLEDKIPNTRVLFTGDPNQKTEGVGFPLLNASSKFYGNLHITESLTISQRSGNYDIIQAQNTFLSAGGEKVNTVSVTSNTDSTEGVEGLSYNEFLRMVSNRMKQDDKKTRMIIVDDQMSEQGKNKLREELGLPDSVAIETVKSSQGQEADEVFIFIPYKDRKNNLQDTMLNGGFHNTANTDMYVALSRAKSYVGMYLGEDIEVVSNKLDVDKSKEGSEILEKKFKDRATEYGLELRAALGEDVKEEMDKFKEERNKNKEATEENLEEKYGEKVDVDENGNVVNEDGEIIDNIKEKPAEEVLTEPEVARLTEEQKRQREIEILERRKKEIKQELRAFQSRLKELERSMNQQNTPTSQYEIVQNTLEVLNEKRDQIKGTLQSLSSALNKHLNTLKNRVLKIKDDLKPGVVYDSENEFEDVQRMKNNLKPGEKLDLEIGSSLREKASTKVSKREDNRFVESPEGELKELKDQIQSLNESIAKSKAALSSISARQKDVEIINERIAILESEKESIDSQIVPEDPQPAKASNSNVKISLIFRNKSTELNSDTSQDELIDNENEDYISLLNNEDTNSKLSNGKPYSIFSAEESGIKSLQKLAKENPDSDVYIFAIKGKDTSGNDTVHTVVFTLPKNTDISGTTKSTLEDNLFSSYSDKFYGKKGNLTLRDSNKFYAKRRHSQNKKLFRESIIEIVNENRVEQEVNEENLALKRESDNLNNVINDLKESRDSLSERIKTETKQINDNLSDLESQKKEISSQFTNKAKKELPEGVEVVSRVIKPRITKDGKLIEEGEVESIVFNTQEEADAWLKEKKRLSQIESNKRREDRQAQLKKELNRLEEDIKNIESNDKLISLQEQLDDIEKRIKAESQKSDEFLRREELTNKQKLINSIKFRISKVLEKRGKDLDNIRNKREQLSKSIQIAKFIKSKIDTLTSEDLKDLNSGPALAVNSVIKLMEDTNKSIKNITEEIKEAESNKLDTTQLEETKKELEDKLKDHYKNLNDRVNYYLNNSDSIREQINNEAKAIIEDSEKTLEQLEASLKEVETKVEEDFEFLLDREITFDDVDLERTRSRVLKKNLKKGDTVKVTKVLGRNKKGEIEVKVLYNGKSYKAVVNETALSSLQDTSKTLLENNVYNLEKERDSKIEKLENKKSKLLTEQDNKNKSKSSKLNLEISVLENNIKTVEDKINKLESSEDVDKDSLNKEYSKLEEYNESLKNLKDQVSEIEKTKNSKINEQIENINNELESIKNEYSVLIDEAIYDAQQAEELEFAERQEIQNELDQNIPTSNKRVKGNPLMDSLYEQERELKDELVNVTNALNRAKKRPVKKTKAKPEAKQTTKNKKSEEKKEETKVNYDEQIKTLESEITELEKKKEEELNKAKKESKAEPTKEDTVKETTTSKEQIAELERQRNKELSEIKSGNQTPKLSTPKGTPAYFSTPNEQGEFTSKGESEPKKGASLYKFFISKDGKTAEFEFFNLPSTYRAALDDPNRILPVSEAVNAYDSTAKKIITHKRGKAVLKDGKWVVTEKAKISYGDLKIDDSDVEYRKKEINDKYDTEYIEKVKKGEIRAQQAKDALKEIDRLTPELSKKIDNADPKTAEQQKSDIEKIIEEISKLPFKDRIPALINSGIIDSNLTFKLGRRFPVIVNIGGVKVPFYRSSSGTGGKQIGKWYPFFGFGKNKEGSLPWLIKGYISAMENYYNSEAIEVYSNILNKTLNWSTDLDRGKIENHPYFKVLSLAKDIFSFNEELYEKGDLEIFNDGESNTTEHINSKLKEINDNYNEELAVLGQSTKELDNKKEKEINNKYDTLISEKRDQINKLKEEKASKDARETTEEKTKDTPSEKEDLAKKFKEAIDERKDKETKTDTKEKKEKSTKAKDYIIEHLENLPIEEEKKEKVKKELRSVKKAERNALRRNEKKIKELEKEIEKFKEKKKRRESENLNNNAVQQVKNTKEKTEENSETDRLDNNPFNKTKNFSNYLSIINKIKERIKSKYKFNLSIEEGSSLLEENKQLLKDITETLETETLTAEKKKELLIEKNKIELENKKLNDFISELEALTYFGEATYGPISELKQLAKKAGYNLPIEESDLSKDRLFKRERDLERIKRDKRRREIIKKNKKFLDEYGISPDTVHDMDQITKILDKLPLTRSQRKLYKEMLVLSKQLGTQILFSTGEFMDVDFNGLTKAGGVYQSVSHSIKINIDGINENVGRYIVHELIHSVTSQTIHSVTSLDEDGNLVIDEKHPLFKLMTDRQKKSVKNLLELLEDIKNDPKFEKDYGATDVFELLAELSNPEFTRKLKFRYSNSQDNLFRKVMNTILGLLGLKKSSYRTVYKSFEDIMTDNNIQRSVLFSNLYSGSEELSNYNMSVLNSLEIQLAELKRKRFEIRKQYSERYKEVLEKNKIEVPKLLSDRIEKYEIEEREINQSLLTANQKQEAERIIKISLKSASDKLDKKLVELEITNEPDGRKILLQDFDGKFLGSVKYGKEVDGYEQVILDVPEDSKISKQIINIALGDSINRGKKGIYVIDDESRTSEVIKENKSMFKTKSLGTGYEITSLVLGETSDSKMILINNYSSTNRYAHKELKIKGKDNFEKFKKAEKSKKTRKAKKAAPIPMKEEISDSESKILNEDKPDKNLTPVIVNNKIKNEIGEEFDEDFDEIIDFELESNEDYPEEKKPKSEKGDPSKVENSNYIFPVYDQIDSVEKDMELISFMTEDTDEFGGKIYRRVYVMKNPDPKQNNYVQVGVDKALTENPLEEDTAITQTLLQEYSENQVNQSQGKEVYKVTGKSKLSFIFDNDNYKAIQRAKNFILPKIKELFKINNQEIGSVEMEPVILTTKNVKEITQQLKDSSMFTNEDSFKLGRTYLRFFIKDISGNEKYFFVPTRAKKKSKDSEEYKTISTFIEEAEKFNLELKNKGIDIAEFGSNEEITLTSTSKKGDKITVTKHRAAILILQGKQSFFEEIKDIKTPPSSSTFANLLFKVNEKPSLENANIAEGSIQYDKHIVVQSSKTRELVGMNPISNKDYPGWAIVNKTMGNKTSKFYRAVFTINHEVKGEIVSDHYVIDIPTEDNDIVKDGTVRVYKNLKLEDNAEIDRKALNTFPADYKSHVPKLDKGMSPEEVANYYLNKIKSNKKYENGPVQVLVNNIARSNNIDFRREGKRYDEKEEKVLLKTYYQSLFRGNPDFNLLEGLKNIRDNFDTYYDNIKVTDVYGKYKDHDKVYDQLETSISDVTPTTLQVEKIEGVTEADPDKITPNPVVDPGEEESSIDDVLSIFGNPDQLEEFSDIDLEDTERLDKINEEETGEIGEDVLGNDIYTEEEDLLQSKNPVLNPDEIEVEEENKQLTVEKAFSDPDNMPKFSFRLLFYRDNYKYDIKYEYDEEIDEYVASITSFENENYFEETIQLEDLETIYNEINKVIEEGYLDENSNIKSFDSLLLKEGINNLTDEEIIEDTTEDEEDFLLFSNLEKQNVEFDLSIEGALEYLQMQFPYLRAEQMQTVPLAVIQAQKGKNVYGYYKNGIYYLGTQDGKISTEVLRHETFHLIFNRYLTPEQRKAILKIVGESRKYKSWLNENNLEDSISNREEYIAYDFQNKNWNYNKFNSPVLQFMHNMYLKIKNIIQSAFDFFMLEESDRIVQQLQRDILSGKFDTIQNNISNERLMKDLSKSFKSNSLNNSLRAFRDVSTYMKDYFYDKLEDGNKEINERFKLDFDLTRRTGKFATTDGKLNFETVYGKMIFKIKTKFNNYPVRNQIDAVLKNSKGTLEEALKIFNDYNETIPQEDRKISVPEFYIYVLSRNSNFIDNLANFLFQQGDARKAYQLATQFKQLAKDEEIDIEDISINLESEIMENNQHNNEKSVGKKLKKHFSLVRRSDQNMRNNPNVDKYINFRKSYVKALSFLSNIDNMANFGFIQKYLKELKEKSTSLDDKHIIDKLQEIWELANMFYSRTSKPVSLDLTYKKAKNVDGERIIVTEPLVDSYNNKIIIAGRVFKFDSKSTNYNVFLTRIMREVEKALNQLMVYQSLSKEEKQTYFQQEGVEKSPLLPFVSKMLASKIYGSEIKKGFTTQQIVDVIAKESMKYINDVYVRGFHRDMVASINYDMRQTKTNPHLVSKEEYKKLVEGDGPFLQEQKVGETYRMTALTTDSIQTAIVNQFRTYVLRQVINEETRKSFKEEVEKELTRKTKGKYNRQVSDSFIRKVFGLKKSTPISTLIKISLYSMLQKQQDRLIGKNSNINTVTEAFLDSGNYMREISEELAAHEEFLSAQNYIDGRNNKRYIWVIRSAIYDVINPLKLNKRVFSFSSRNNKLFNKANIFLTGLQKVSDYIEFDTLKVKESLYPGKVIKNLSGQQYYGLKFVAGFLGTAITNENLYYQFGVRESNRNIEGGAKIKILGKEELGKAIEAGAEMESRIMAIKNHLLSDKFKQDKQSYKKGEKVDNSFYLEKFGMTFRDFFNGYNVKNMNKSKEAKFKKDENLDKFINRTKEIRNNAFFQFVQEWNDVEGSELKYIYTTVRKFHERNSDLVKLFLPKSYQNKKDSDIPSEILLRASFDVFWTQNYINGYHYDNMIFGNHHFTKNPENHIKREQGGRSPGKPVLTGKGYAPVKSNIAVYNDIERVKTVGNDLKNLYSKIHGVPFEITDAATFILPETLGDLQRGTGDYSLGEVIKNVVFYTDPISGKPVYIKTASFVLTPALRSMFPELDRIAKDMEKNNVKHYIPKSAFKLGCPIEAVNPGESIQSHHISDLYMRGYKIQSNPVSLKEKSKVSNFSQLNYFLNVNLKNFVEAMKVYTADSSIASFAFKKFNLENDIYDENRGTYNTNNIVKSILKTLKESETGYRMAEIVEQGKISHNFPYVVRNFITQISNIISKKTLEVKHVGNKLTVQPSLGVEFYEGQDGLLSYDELSDTDKAKADKFLNLPYEVRDFIKMYDKKTFFNDKYNPIIKSSTVYNNMSEANRNLVEEAFNSDEYLLPRKLKMRTEDNYTEVIAPQWWLDQNNLEEGDYIYNHDKMSTAIAIRIPTTGIHSAVPIRIVASPTKTNLIIAPEELVPLHGSDFDVDALFYIRRETASKKDRIRVFETVEDYINYNNKLKDIKTKYRKKKLFFDKKMKELEKEYSFKYGLIGYDKDGNWDTKFEEKVLSQISELEVSYDKDTKKYLSYLYDIAIKLEKNKKIDAYLDIITAEKNQEDMNTPIEFTAIKADIFQEVNSTTTPQDIIEAFVSAELPDSVRKEVEEVLKDENGNWIDPTTWLDFDALKSTERYREGRLIITDKEIMKGLLKTKLGAASKLKIVTGKTSLSEKRDVYDIGDNYKYHEDNFQGVSGTGIQANLMKVVSYLLFASKMKGGTGKLLPIVTTDSKGNDVETPRNYVFNGITYDSFEVYTKRDNVRTTELGDTVLNGYIDNVKELITGIINANGHTIGMIGTMISIGIDIDTITYFMQQPIIRYISSNPSGIDIKIRNSKKFLTSKLPKDKVKKLQDINITDEVLIDNIRFDENVGSMFKSERLLDHDLEEILIKISKQSIEHAKAKLNTWQSKRAKAAGKELKDVGDISISEIISPDIIYSLELMYPGFNEELNKLEKKINDYINEKQNNFKELLEEAKNDDGTIDSEFKKAKQKAIKSLFEEESDDKKGEIKKFFSSPFIDNILEEQKVEKDRIYQENRVFYESQLEVLKMFEQINQLSSDIEQNTKFLKIVKDLPVNYEDILKIQESNTSDKLVAPLTDVPNISAAAERLNFLKGLIEDTFKLFNTEYTNTFMNMVETLKFNTEGNLHSSFEKTEMIRADFQTYLMTGVIDLVPTEGYIGFNSRGGLTKNISDVTRFTSERELRIQILIDKINKYILDNKQNKFISFLKPKLTRKGLSRLEFLAGTNLDPTQELELTNAYLQLPTELKQLLIQYAAIVEGSKFGFKSYSKFIPPTESEPGANDGLDYISEKFEEILNSIDEKVLDNFEKQFTYLNQDKVQAPKGLRLDGDMLIFSEEAKVDPDKLPNYVVRYNNVYKLINIPDLKPYYVEDGVVDNNNYIFMGEPNSSKRLNLSNNDIRSLVNNGSLRYSSSRELAEGEYSVYSNTDRIDTNYVVTAKKESGGITLTDVKKGIRQSKTSNSRPINEVKLNRTLEILKKNTGLDYSTDPTEFKKALEKTGHKGAYPAGFVYKNKVYINTTGEGNMYGADTALHEYAHLYIDHIRKTNPTLYNRILILASKNEYYESVKEQYPELSGNDLLEEVAVTFIGTQGRKNSTIMSAIKRVLRSLGIESFTTLGDLANDLLTKNLELENVELESIMFDINKLKEQMISNGEINIEYNELCK